MIKQQKSRRKKSALPNQKLQRKFALLPARNEVITVAHVQALLDGEVAACGAIEPAVDALK